MSSPDAPRRPARGLSTGMKAVLAATALLGALSFVLLECVERGKPTKARTHWNAPPAATKLLALDHAIQQGAERAAPVVAQARLTRLEGRHLDAAGQIHLDYGSVTVGFAAADPAAQPCSISFALSWQGWGKRTGGPCGAPALELRCTPAEAFRRAFPDAPEAATAGFELEGGRWKLWRLDDGQGAVTEVADDCR